MTVPIPEPFRERVSGYPADPGQGESGRWVSGADWVRRLPALLADLLGSWSLTPDGQVGFGRCAVAVPVRSADGSAVLKVGWPHREAATEHLALRRWDGVAAVRLLRADPNRFALLLERLDNGTDLNTIDIDDACGVIGDLLTDLTSPALPQTPTLSDYLERQQVRPLPAGLPRRFVEQARHLAADLGQLDGVDAHLLHTDLHYDNVLRGRRRPWLAIDPKPLAGHRAFEVAPALWNRSAELGSGAELRWSLRRRVEVLCERAGIDEAAAKAFAIVRVVDLAGEEPPGSPASTLAVEILKAMND